MKYRINQIKLHIDEPIDVLSQKIAGILRIPLSQIKSVTIRKKSLDARKKPDLFYLVVADVEVDKPLRKLPKDVMIKPEDEYVIPRLMTDVDLLPRPLVIGMGPAGLFAGYLLCLLGCKPILIDRGRPVEQRKKDVAHFWERGCLDPESNVQFGEGGAGTFSDGKLNTLVKDKLGRCRFVLQTFVKYGAPENILYDAKPHIGTDVLEQVITNMRNDMISMGADFRYETKAVHLLVEDHSIRGVQTESGDIISTGEVVLAIGHSARDTFYHLYEEHIDLEAKSFAVGLRVEHSQAQIDFSQYGMPRGDLLPAASYKLTAQTSSGRGVYTFCMCPGGYVVNASSEPGRLAVNGMSYHARDGIHANSAVIVTVTPDDFPSDHPLAGVEFQRDLEAKAYSLGKGKIPVQTFGSFEAQKADESLADLPQCKGAYEPAPLHTLMTKEMTDSLIEGMHSFGHKIKGFDAPETLLSGIESRTSSPVRITRNEFGEALSLKGLYPCGEGAGYAGGITSAAMDGLYIAEKIIERRNEHVGKL